MRKCAVWHVPTAMTRNMELNDLRKIICLKKPEVYVKKKKKKKKQFVMSLENWWSMTYTVCHAPIQKTLQIYHYIATMTSF